MRTRSSTRHERVPSLTLKLPTELLRHVVETGGLQAALALRAVSSVCQAVCDDAVTGLLETEPLVEHLAGFSRVHKAAALVAVGRVKAHMLLLTADQIECQLEIAVYRSSEYGLGFLLCAVRNLCGAQHGSLITALILASMRPRAGRPSELADLAADISTDGAWKQAVALAGRSQDEGDASRIYLLALSERITDHELIAPWMNGYYRGAYGFASACQWNDELAARARCVLVDCMLHHSSDPSILSGGLCVLSDLLARDVSGAGSLSRNYSALLQFHAGGVLSCLTALFDAER